MGSEVPGVQPAPWAQSHEQVWVVTDPGGWWGETHTSHAAGNPPRPLPSSCPLELPPSSRLPSPWQDQTDTPTDDISLAIPFHLWASRTLPARMPAMRRENWLGSRGSLAVGMGRKAVLKHRSAGWADMAGGRWGRMGGGLCAFPQMPIHPSPFPASGNLLLATVLPRTPVFRES